MVGITKLEACQVSDHKQDEFRKTNSQHGGKKLSLLAFTVLVFYEVCGGAFGLEDIVRFVWFM